jgi:hypothetical protein
MVLGYILGDFFSQKHLVTLPTYDRLFRLARHLSSRKELSTKNDFQFFSKKTLQSTGRRRTAKEMEIRSDYVIN